MKNVFVVILCCLLFAACTTSRVVTYDTVAVTENPVGTKVGQIDRRQGGILEAARNANITRISTVSTQNTDTYVTYYWPVLLMQSPSKVHTNRLAEIIVTGE